MSEEKGVLINREKRLICLSDDIDNESVGQICFNLLCIIKDDDIKESEDEDYERKPICLYINSCGGSIYDMWALIDLITNSPTPIYTYCTGYAMSAAFELFLAGHQRYATKHATFMYHQPYLWKEGWFQEFVENRGEWEWMNEASETFILENTHFTAGELQDIREHKQDFYIHADEALRLGIVDAIL